MTPKEKAKQLVESNCELLNNHIFSGNYDIAKEFALKTVDEIYYGLYNYLKDTNELQNADREFAYWENVKTEIEKL